MKAETKKFEIKFIRMRNAIERKGIRMIKSALVDQYKEFLDKADNLPPSMWTSVTLSEEPINKFFKQFYPMSSMLGGLVRKNMISQKSDEDDLYESMYQQYLQQLVGTQDYMKRISSITSTSKDRINTVLQDLFTDAELDGWGVDKTRRELVKRIGDQIKGNVTARAQSIAQTEMISASNQASKYAADSTGLEYRKFWSTSHLQGIRSSHIAAEQDSISRGGLKPAERHINGLLYPGDPSGSVEEIVNCRCTELYEVV